MLYEHDRGWRRLTELHDRATTSRRWRPTTVPRDLTARQAAAAHARTGGAAWASFVLASQTERQALATSLARHALEAKSTRGLESAILTGLAATIDSRLPGYDRLHEAVSSLGFEHGLNAGAGGVAFLDVRDGTIGFVGQDALTSSLEVLDAVVGRPGEGPPPFTSGGSGKSNDPALVGMDSEPGEGAAYAAVWVVSTYVGLIQVSAGMMSEILSSKSDPYMRTAGSLLGTFASFDLEGLLLDSLYVDFYQEETADGTDTADTTDGTDTADGENTADGEEKDDADGEADEDGEDGEDTEDGETDGTDKPADPDGAKEPDEDTMPNPAGDDHGPVFDIRYVEALIAAHSPRTAGDGEGRSFWVNGGLILKPHDLVIDPPQESLDGTFAHPVDLEAILMSRKRPVNPKTSGAKGTEPAAVIAVEGVVPLPLVTGENGSVRLPW